ncbi:hypothetical protein B0F87_107151 [Methylobacter tundripaludum]|uniref:Uncharacterized protein n=1 Tax=Methylobacter tundripaludum TaxID=173365 RepID=A0A2S6HBS3_9GAMM|nr:hypothetical protein [Methylobacter tundripaludum]PPK74908.1 hypothetical protein B0F87_107151 [Methylobacter tundripaludum]
MSGQDKATKLTGENVNSDEKQYGLKSGTSTDSNTKEKYFNGREFSEALDKIEDTNYVFFFGQQGSGKSVIIGSLLRSLNEGKSNKGGFILNKGDNIKHKGCKELLQEGYRFAYNAHEILKQKRFMARNDKGDLTIINGRFEPTIEDCNPLDITFLDVAGEDLIELDANHGQGKLPNHINIFLKLSTLPLLIILVVPHDPTIENKPEGYTDRLMAQFLETIDKRSSQDKLKKPRIMLLITQWDSYAGKYQNDVTAFAKTKLPSTYTLLNRNRDLISEYSIGRVIELTEGELSIDPFYEEYPIRVWNRIYETFTGKSLNKKPWWQFF